MNPDIQELVGKDELLKALDTFLAVIAEARQKGEVDTDLAEQLTIDLTNLRAQLVDNERERLRLTGDPGLLSRARNKISDSLLQLYETFREAHTPPQPASHKSIPLVADMEALRLLIAEKLGNDYSISREIIHNSDRSVIFKGYYTRADEQNAVAIKVIKPYSMLEPENQKDLHTDIRETYRLSKQDGIITILDQRINTDSYPWYFIMDYIDGYTLQHYVEWGWPFPLYDIKQILLEIIESVRSLHEVQPKGIVHGNLAPNKIILKEKLSGFQPVISPFRVIGDAFFNRRTNERVLENVRYMSPEELFGHPPTSRSDQYAIGLVAIELLELRPLYTGSTVMEIVEQRMKHRKDPDFVSAQIQNAHCPAELKQVLRRLLAYEAAERHENLEAVQDLISDIHIDRRSHLPDEPGLQKQVRLARKSYMRVADEAFFEAFYQQFFRSCEAEGLKGIAEKFKDLNAQKRALKRAISSMLQFGSPVYHHQMRQRLQQSAQRHHSWQIPPKAYELFEQALLDCLRRADAAYWSTELARAWQELLGKSIALMQAGGQHLPLPPSEPDHSGSIRISRREGKAPD
ncbi:MAG: hypothetical protein D6730_14355 [Bacteroidetes bacterium]|nr:MAG: hypothetical protein D6730_14355 [Bacteroidota bacterium]